MIGEIRDLETAEIVVQSALTGHLVLSTLHTNDAGSSLTRLLDMGGQDYLLTSTINGILMTKEGGVLYFHRNSMLAGDFDDLKPGDEVFYVEEMDDTGPIASRVRVKTS